MHIVILCRAENFTDMSGSEPEFPNLPTHALALSLSGHKSAVGTL